MRKTYWPPALFKPSITQERHGAYCAGPSHAVAEDAHTGCRPSSAGQQCSHLQVAHMSRWTSQHVSARPTGLPHKGIVEETYTHSLTPTRHELQYTLLGNTMRITEQIHTWCLWKVFEIWGWEVQLWTYQILTWSNCLNTRSTNTRGWAQGHADIEMIMEWQILRESTITD